MPRALEFRFEVTTVRIYGQGGSKGAERHGGLVSQTGFLGRGSADNILCGCPEAKPHW